MAVRFPDQSEWMTTAMRIVDGLLSRGAWMAVRVEVIVIFHGNVPLLG
ncbi:MAG: hypothetical protein AAGA71_01580 [Pseudomonadota bacterium]